MARSDGRANAPDLERVPGWAKSLLPIALLNWFLFFLVTGLLGGVAIGTTPRRGDFYLTSQGRRTVVTEGVWLFSLIYSWWSLVLPVLGFWTLAPFLDRVRARNATPDASLRVTALRWLVALASLFGLFWFYLVVRDGFSSLFAYIGP